MWETVVVYVELVLVDDLCKWFSNVDMMLQCTYYVFFSTQNRQSFMLQSVCDGCYVAHSVTSMLHVANSFTSMQHSCYVADSVTSI